MTGATPAPTAGIGARHPRIVLAVLGAALAGLMPLALSAHGRWDADFGFIAVVLAQAVLYLLAAAVARRTGGGAAVLAIVLIGAATLRLLVLFEPPLHSTDVFRYVWDGRVQGEGINPYRYVPGDPALLPLRDAAIFANINRADYAVTIYPPVAQMAFWLFTRAAETVPAVKLGWLLLEAAAMLALVRLLARQGRPASQLLLYAWHPLPVWEIACDGHVDAGMLALLVLALWAWDGGRRLVAGALLAGSALFKPLTLAALPAFWKPWDWRVPAAFLACVLLAYLAYSGVGRGVLGFLPVYFGEEGMRSGQGFLALQLLGRALGPLPAAATAVYAAGAAMLLAGIAVLCVRDRRRDAPTAAMQAQVLLLVALLALSPNYPWYFLVLVPLGCLAPWGPARAATLLAVVLYAAPPIDGDARTVLAQSLFYGSVMAALALDLYNRLGRRRRRAAQAGRGPDDDQHGGAAPDRSAALLRGGGR